MQGATRWMAIMILGSACGAPASAPAEPGSESEGGPLGKADDASRRSLVHEQIAAWNAHLSAADRDEKFAKMAADPFSFYRGSNHLYWMDFGYSPLLEEYGGPGTAIWLQGDLHANNYGVFDDDQGRIVYDLNDFDESIIADYQLDLWRMATSVVLVGRANGLDEDEIAAAVDGLTETYLDTLDDMRGNDDEAERVVHQGNAYGRLDELLRDVEDGESRQEMLDDWTRLVDGDRTLDTSLEDLEAVDAATEAAIIAALPAYGETLSGGIDFDEDAFRPKSVARRLHAGVGSLGTPRYYVLIEGPSADPDDDVLLDIKRQGEPTGLSFVGSTTRDRHAEWFPDHAVRVVRAHKALGTRVDDYLGWLQLDGESYGVRARSPFKKSFPLEELDSETRLVKLSEQWGSILAVAHARSDEDYKAQWVPYDFEDEVHALTDGHHAEVRERVRGIAFDYATQVEIDYGFFLELL